MDSAWTTYPAQPHSLPFRTIFGEYRARRRQDLADATTTLILKQERRPDDLDLVWAKLDEAIKKSEDAYADLGTKKEAVSAQRPRPDESLADFKARLADYYEQVLLAEELCQVADAPLKSILHAMQATAVCLSGGGIRSASFSLGVLEGLSRFSRQHCRAGQKLLMDGLDYLSTVSGGGYIGSWLIAWAARSNYDQVIDQLSESAKTSGDPEPQPIRHLREYTSYLSPRYGFTLDTFTLLGIVARNLVLNWMILVPTVIALFSLPEFLYDLSYGWPFSCRDNPYWFLAMMVGAFACVLFASLFAVQRMSRSPYASAARRHRQGRASLELYFFALPLLLGAWLIAEASAWAYLRHTLTSQQWPLLKLTVSLFWFTVTPGFAMSVWRLRLLHNNDGAINPTPFRRRDGSTNWQRLIWSLIAPIIAGMVSALLLAMCGLYVGGRLIQANEYHIVVGHRFVVLSVPIVMVIMMLGSTVLTGLLTNIEQEEEREWWARAGGLLFACMVTWLAVTATAYYATEWMDFAKATALAMLGLGAGAIGSAAGLSAATASGLKRVKAEQLGAFQRFLARHHLIAPVMSAIALVCLALALATLTSWLRMKLYYAFDSLVLSPYSSGAQHELDRDLGIVVHFSCTPASFSTWINTIDQLKLDTLAALIVFAGAALIAMFANRFVNINTFSLHGMYRMRLTRAYLGASNFARHPDTFTNFDRTDNIHEADLPEDGVPLHIINTALNVVATRNMAWQQRKAEPFTFSPVSVGSWRLGYVPTDQYGGSRGVRLGTAMAISGAAFNPNMGYNSSPLVTLLMTFFNARLGWWLPNPIWPLLRKLPEDQDTRHFRRMNGPKWALMPLINEALGNTDDTYKWIELSDGGHFENLALYEMVLRRCRRIIVVDADADGGCEFEDLGNAIRKIEIDLGIPISFPKFPHGLPMKKGTDAANVYCVVGSIEYGCVDAGAEAGELLLIKPVLNASEPPDIRSYAAAHPTFPHETTADQFFNEAQFESYRHLGSWVVRAILGDNEDAGDQAPETRDCTMEAFFAQVESCRAANAVSATREPAKPSTAPTGETDAEESAEG